MPDWAQGFANRLYGGMRDFLREGAVFELEFEQPSSGDLPDVSIGADWRGDGLLVFRYTAEEAEAWRRNGVKVVNLSSETPPGGATPVPQVIPDNLLCGRMAARHLMGLGLRRFAFWHDPLRTYSQERLAGFRDEIEAAGHVLEVLEIPSSSFPAAERARLNEAVGLAEVARLTPPCGLFAKDDIAAVMAVRALKCAGMKVPGDVAVLGVADDVVFCHGTTPALSSLRFPAREIGRRAAAMLHEMMTGRLTSAETPLRTLVPPHGVVVRESTDQIELEDKLISRALRIIRKDAPSGRLTAHDVCRRTGLSREALRLRFRETLGRSVKREIDGCRAEHICDLLRHTNWTIDQIAAQCGFSSGDELCRFFKRVVGESPGKWRGSRGVNMSTVDGIE